jgi:hypothetical protein
MIQARVHPVHPRMHDGLAAAGTIRTPDDPPILEVPGPPGLATVPYPGSTDGAGSTGRRFSCGGETN